MTFLAYARIVVKYPVPTHPRLMALSHLSPVSALTSHPWLCFVPPSSMFNISLHLLCHEIHIQTSESSNTSYTPVSAFSWDGIIPHSSRLSDKLPLPTTDGRELLPCPCSLGGVVASPPWATLEAQYCMV